MKFVLLLTLFAVAFGQQTPSGWNQLDKTVRGRHAIFAARYARNQNSLLAKPLPSGLTRYAAPEGLHDDCVMSLALAWQGLGRRTSRAANHRHRAGFDFCGVKGRS